jgi:zinc/manganese transport system substrate-binding protein
MKNLILVLFAIASMPAVAALKVFATVPEWGALAQEIGGDQVQVFTATTALQDAHHIDARPSLIARARSADLLVATGAELEVGWLPVVQRESGNPRIQSGQPGYFAAAAAARLLDVPARLDRADGDVHAAGNPHIQTDPRNFLAVARRWRRAWRRSIRPMPRPTDSGYAAFSRALARAAQALGSAGGAAQGGGRGHRSTRPGPTSTTGWACARWHALEPKPGVEPSLAHLCPGARPGGDKPPAHGDPCRLQLGATRGVVRAGGQGAGRGAPVHCRRAGGGRPDGAVRDHCAAPARGLVT